MQARFILIWLLISISLGFGSVAVAQGGTPEEAASPQAVPTAAPEGAGPLAPAPATETTEGPASAGPAAQGGAGTGKAAVSRAAPGEIVQDISVRGNAKVESDAIVTLLKTRKGQVVNLEDLQDDLRSLYELGYFSDIRFYKKAVAGGIQLIVDVKEKPAITSISFEGNSEITDDTLKDKLETKVYTIVNETTITADVRMIEKQYAEKGYYLARVTYTLDKKSASDVALVFHVDEGGKVLVGSVDILGNKFFTKADIVSGVPGMASRPYTRSSAFSSASLYQEDFVKRDLEYISYIYRDHGFAEVKVAKPFQRLDSDRNFVRLTFQVEEGLQYNIGSIDIAGDLLFTKQELLDKMKLKTGALFKYSFLTQDNEMLVDKYGDLGYAYADIYPDIKFDRAKKLAHITFRITKGEKVYFGRMTITGNTKTRDNVIRREFEVADSELYSGTRLAETKDNINRLGFFDEVQIIKERDEHQQNLLNLQVKVKEKATGQLQAAVGFTPATATSAGSQWFGQGRYEEKNQSGKGWGTQFSGKWNGEQNYSIDAGFSNPRVNDSQWSAGADAFYSNELENQLDEVQVTTRKVGGSVFVGRKVVELIRATVRYRLQKTLEDTEGVYVMPQFIDQGIASSMIFSLSRTDVDNYIDPTSGTDLIFSQAFTGGSLLRGDQKYMESTADATAYLPVDFGDSYRTYFKLHGVLGYIYPMDGSPVPFNDRYRLGGYNDLRGYDPWTVSPQFSLLRNPGGSRTTIPAGGDKKMYYQLEYFMPLIPEAGIKALLFADAGQVYAEDELISFKNVKKDLGFGFRWITPIAPFRFEWAYPVLDNGRLGDMKIIFYIGY